MTLDNIEVKNDPTKEDIKFILELLDSNKLIDAKKAIDKQIIKFPNSSVLFNILGAILAGQNQLNEAVEKYTKAVKINPNYAQAYNNLGVALHKLNRIGEAIDNYRKAISLKSDFVEALNNLGHTYQDFGNKKEALDNFQKVIKIKPDYAEVYNNLGMLFNDLTKFDEALLNYNKAIKLKPDYDKPYNNLGNLLSSLGKYDEAISAYHRAIKIKPDYSIAYSNLLLNLNYKTDFDPNLYLSEAKKFNLNCKPKKNLFFHYQYDKNPKKLKIGFISADFGNHPGGYFTLSTLRELTRKNFDLIAYSVKDRTDEFSFYFRSLFSKWRSIERKKDEEVVKQIIEDEIHILIDAQGHSANNRLPIFMYKAAPIQVSWLSTGTLGISEIDYLIGSSHITPKNEENHFVEKIWRLPEITQCFTPPDFDVKINSLPVIKNNFIIFGCLNKLTKVNDVVVALWSKILLTIPNSKLYLKTGELDDKKIVENIFARFKKYKIDKNRLILEGKSETRKKVLEVYNKIDIALDPFPFQGNTSTIEAIWMGVPVLTLKGNRLVFHFGESINSNLNMYDWIAENHNEYVSKAIEFSSNIDQLSAIRMNLRQKILQSPVCDAARFVEHFNKMLWDMWRKFSAKK